jgi:hypothetical protein
MKELTKMPKVKLENVQVKEKIIEQFYCFFSTLVLHKINYRNFVILLFCKS